MCLSGCIKRWELGLGTWVWDEIRRIGGFPGNVKKSRLQEQSVSTANPRGDPCLILVLLRITMRNCKAHGNRFLPCRGHGMKIAHYLKSVCNSGVSCYSRRPPSKELLQDTRFLAAWCLFQKVRIETEYPCRRFQSVSCCLQWRLKSVIAPEELCKKKG
jgi:hypothetical protein